MNLSDNDRRDAIKFIESGKPLPDEFRFKLFGDKREVELVWNGKTNEVTNVVLPFQTIEHIDEPREEDNATPQLGFTDVSVTGRQIGDWTNKLIWGDNKLILSSLKNGPLREEIEKQGGIKLIYIDPPFDVGADFSMDIEIGDETFHKEPSVLEELAYRDTWGKGADSFIAMIYERLSLMRDLLAEDGSIYVHCDWRLNSYLRLILDELFGGTNFRNEIIWSYKSGGVSKDRYARKHDTLLLYGKSQNSVFNQQFERTYKYGGIGKSPLQKYYKDDRGEEYCLVSQTDVFGDIGIISTHNKTQRLDYPTQKPEALLERIINASSNEGDIVADFFAGSGTTLAAAEKLGRKWIGADLGRFSIHTTRKRMISVQRELKKNGKDYRAFEILNLGRYERQYYIGENPDFKDEKTFAIKSKKEQEFVKLILSAYKAESVTQLPPFSGKKNNRLVVVGPADFPASRSSMDQVIESAQKAGCTKVDYLAFEFEMGLIPEIQDEAKQKGVDLALKYIPRDVFDKRVVEKNEVVFYDAAFAEIKPHIKQSSISIELTDFGVFYNQDVIGQIEAELKNGSSKVTVDGGQIVKISKDADGITKCEILTKHWTDWVDYWSVDFNFESKKEIIRILKPDAIQQKLDGSSDVKQLKLDNFEEKWTGNYIFENDWQSFRTKKDRKLELTTPPIEVPSGSRKIAVKVIDIFGNDTTKVVSISI